MVDGDLTLDDALGLLQKTTSATGGSVFEHLTDVVAKVSLEQSDHVVTWGDRQILREPSENALDLLEASYVEKRKIAPPLSASRLSGASLNGDADLKRAEAFLKLLKDPEPVVDPETGAAAAIDPPNEYTCQDVRRDGALFDAVGVGLEPEETHSIALMMKALGEDPERQVASVRFFGKFFVTKERDYYVFETTLKAPDTPTDDEADEAAPTERGVGVNAFVYFVCNAADNVFTRLPDATPQQIRVARTLRRFLTGDLDADVSAFPVFPGTEKDYLRAQIARIACATTLSPAGHFVVSDDGTVEKSEETPSHAAEQLAELANWVHLRPHLKRQGRCTVYVRAPPEDGEAPALTEDEQEEGPAPLASLDHDVPCLRGAAWTVVRSSALQNLPHQVVGVRSNLWPGAVSAAKASDYASVYLGWGIQDAPFAPAPFPTLQTEQDLPTENPALPANDGA